MKTCTVCKHCLPVAQFNIKSGNRRHSACSECTKLQRRKSYLKYKNRIQAKTAANRKKYRDAGSITWIKDLLSKCGQRVSVNITAEQRNTLAEKLAKSLADNPVCPFLGLKLVPGVNIALDHKKPISRYPKLAFRYSNLQWVSSTYNKAKHNLTDNEFRKLCRTVLFDRIAIRNKRGNCLIAETVRLSCD